MTTPPSVLEAGRKERERWEVRNTLVLGKLARDVVYLVDGAVHCHGTQQECQDFVDDRAFRAKLRALADEREWLHRMQFRLEPMISDDWEYEQIENQLGAAFKWMAGDDDAS